MKRTLFLLVLLAASLPTLAQEPAVGEPLSSFGEVIDVRVVNLEVVVTDREGVRVPGLSRGDFRLLVDGREIPIEFFTEVREGEAMASPSAEGEGPGATSVVPDGPVGTSFLVFIDNLFSLRVRRDEVLRGLKADIAQMGPEDRMAVVAYDGRKLVKLCSWIRSPDELSRAVEQAFDQRAYGINEKAALAAMEASQRLVPSDLGRGLSFDQLVYAQQLNDRIERAVMAAVSTLRAFSQAPGRKVMLLLAGGWPASPAAYAANSLGPVYDLRLPWHGNLYGPIIDTANRLGYTVYPVDVPGLEASGPDASAASPTAPGLFDQRENEIHTALRDIAASTGGRPLLNESRLASLRTVHADTRSYYWLGFTPSWRQKDQRHGVQVEVKRPDLKVRSRSGFLDMSRSAEVTMMVEHALLFGGNAATPTMPIAVGTGKRTSRKEMLVPLSLTIPLSSITLLRSGNRYVTQLELRVAAMDERGDRSEIPVIPLHFDFDRPPPPSGGHIRYDTELQLRRIEQHLIVTLFDPLSGKITTAEADVGVK